jgi:hypothetical protein
MGGNKYRVGIATASISSFTGQISVEGTYTGGVITGVTREVSAYNPSGNPNTVAPATPTNVSDAQTAILAKLPESARAATAADVSPTINFTPTINPAVLSEESINEIRDGLSTFDPEADQVTAVLDSSTLVRFVTENTGETTAAAGSVAKLSQGSGSGGGDATLEKQEEILTAIQGSEVIQVASPNVSGNLVLTQGDDYDGVANPKASWTVSTDYTSGWTVRLTIRDADDALIYTTTGTVVSATVIAVTIAAPTGLTMTGCPGQWQGKFDVELTHSSGKKKTIALGVCYINEDQTR